MSYAVVDLNTGAVLTELREGDRITRKKSIEAYKEYVGRIPDDCETWGYGNYIRVNAEELEKLVPELNASERAFIFSVLPYVSYTSCELEYRNHVTIQTEGLEKITGLKKTALYGVIKSLVKKNILYRGRNGNGLQFFMNPWVVSKGTAINKTLKAMFKNYKIRSLGNKQWGSLKNFF